MPPIDGSFDPIPNTATKQTNQGLVVVDVIDSDLIAHVTVIGRVGNQYARWYSHSVNRKHVRYPLHRVIMERITGEPIPAGMVVDHINGDTFDNRRENLRLCTRAENNRNAKIRSNNTSGFKGVSYNKKMKRYGAAIRVNGRQRTIGFFDTPEDAHAAYVNAARDLHGEFANDGDGCLVSPNKKL